MKISLRIWIAHLSGARVSLLSGSAAAEVVTEFSAGVSTPTGGRPK
jgi:hypothetical protein